MLVSVLDTLLERERLVDVTLAAEGQFINVHRLVLFACSQYFDVSECVRCLVCQCLVINVVSCFRTS